MDTVGTLLDGTLLVGTLLDGTLLDGTLLGGTLLGGRLLDRVDTGRIADHDRGHCVCSLQALSLALQHYNIFIL